MPKDQIAGEDRFLPLESIQLVAIDLDGTLLRSDGSICMQAAQVIYELNEKGVKVVLATGRAPRSVRSIHDALDLKTPIVSQNGALIYDLKTDEILHHQTLDADLARQVVEIAQKAEVDPGAGRPLQVGVDVIDHCYQAKDGDDWLDQALAQPVTKVAMIGEQHTLGGIQTELKSQLADQVNFAFSDLILLQVVANNADKADALQILADRYEIPQHRTMALGDAPNDLGMIRWAALGVAPQNGWPDVLDAAHFTVPDNDNAGIARALRTYVLEQQ